MIADWAHELRTPLHAVLAAVALLGETALTAEQRAHVETIGEAARALVDVADTALGAAVEVPNGAECDPRRIVDGVRRMLAPAAHAKALAFAVAVDADVPSRLRAPAGPLRQVLVNLVGNAIKFTTTGRVALHVRRVPAVDDAELVPVVLEVHDTGPGLDAAQQARLFQPFSRPGGSDAPGTGLGLAISAALVRRMGGDIAVRGAPGEGCMFAVRLSAWPDAPPARIATDPLGTPPPEAAHRVLVVDDDPIGRRVTAQLLARLGCRADTAATIADAEHAVATTRYDALLLDRHLGDADGCDLAAAIRRRERESAAPRLRIVALTAGADATTRRQCVAAGMDACLVKPVGVDELRDALALPTDASAAAPVVDEARLVTLARLDADAPGLLASVAADYARGAESQLVALRAAIATGDLAAAARAAHAIRGSSATAGAPRAAAIAADIERAAHAGHAAPIDSLAALAAAVGAAATLLADRRPDATVGR